MFPLIGIRRVLLRPADNKQVEVSRQRLEKQKAGNPAFIINIQNYNLDIFHLIFE
jgi:hypothetical protein|uniref:Uncharacterized protein n=1 Tax=Myoviridae sp. ctCo31 TaxID=2825053 RepID=A0A8S5UMB1_9CAUD|nr:MAG TPA: hypothetical protein [Myoviridae sp. ctCo31]